MEELAYLDKQAMFAELERPGKLEVIYDVQPGVEVGAALPQDTKLVWDWRFRQGPWPGELAWLLVNSEDEAAQQRTLSVLRHLWWWWKFSWSLQWWKVCLFQLWMSSDAFLQVLQRDDVVVAVPNWVRMEAENSNLLFWQLLKRHPGQRNAATRWN